MNSKAAAAAVEKNTSLMPADVLSSEKYVIEFELKYFILI